MAKKVLTDMFSELLNGATTARVEINAGDANLTIDSLIGDESLLAGGTLQYLEKQGTPTRTLVPRDGQAALTLKGGGAGQPWFRFPWSACNGATDWKIHLNPTVTSELIAHSDGGNVKLNLAGMPVTRVSADTGGGNMEVVLPDKAANLNMSAQTGAGNVAIESGSVLMGSNLINAKSGAGDVDVRIPRGVAARIHVTIGVGVAIVDPRFSKIDKNTYQSPDFDSAADQVEITVQSGAGNVSVN
jgi:hypothetical protein